jgi:large subunit ribosomal protein L4
MKYDIFDQSGKKISQTLLPKEIFEVKMNFDLVHQVVCSQMSNRRQIIAHSKDRGEVSGGGRKPWRQKGTGRARVGSIRSPLWRGGGVTFGPRKTRVFKKKINKKRKRKALLMVLSAKAKNGLLLILDKMALEKPKTKLMSGILSKLSLKGSSLIALPRTEKNIFLAARNLSRVKTVEPKDLNALDLLSFKYLIMPKEAIKVIKDTFLK